MKKLGIIPALVGDVTACLQETDLSCRELRESVETQADVCQMLAAPFGLAHRNRSDLCDLRLRCPSRIPDIARDLRDKALRFEGAMERR